MLELSRELFPYRLSQLEDHFLQHLKRTILKFKI
jgi:hypothetical protein